MFMVYGYSDVTVLASMKIIAMVVCCYFFSSSKAPSCKNANIPLLEPHVQEKVPVVKNFK